MVHVSLRPPSLALLLVVSMLTAGCGEDSGGSSAVRHVPGGTPTGFAGVTFDLPPGWRAEPRDDALVLMPDGANQSGVVEEMYLLGSDTAVRSLDGGDMERSIAQTIEQLQPGAQRSSGPEPARFGELEGRRWVWSGRSPDGRDVQVRAFGFLGNSGCALLALGYVDALQRRAGDVDAMLASLSRTAAPAGKTGDAGGVRAELVGQWIWMSNFTANNGGGLQTNTWVTLQADGRYQHHYDSVSTNPEGAAWGAQDETGSWTAGEDSISFQPDRGSPYTRALEKRNHPKNHNDPMIVLDGKPYVTATARRPW